MSIALANSGDLQIELIQQRNDAPSMYLDFLREHGEGLQHMSYWSTDYQALYDRAIAAGFKVGHEGQIGGPKGRFAYFETRGSCRHGDRDFRYQRRQGPLLREGEGRRGGLGRRRSRADDRLALSLCRQTVQSARD